MKKILSFKFWKLFTRYFLIFGVFAVLALTSQQGVFGNVWQRGPALSLADKQLTPPTPTPVCNWEFKYPECDWNLKQTNDIYQNTCTGAYEHRNYHFQEGACGYSTPAPVAPVAPTVPVTGPVSTPTVATITVCNGQQKTWDQLQSELHVAGYPGPWDQGSAIAAYNRAACPVNQPVAPVVTPVVTPVIACVPVSVSVGISPSGQTSAGTQTISWNAASNVSTYHLRIDDMTANGWTNSCANVNAGDVCMDNFGGTSYSYNFQAGHTYHIWVGAVNACSDTEIGNVNVSVPAPVVVAPVIPVVPTPVYVPTPVAPVAQAQCPSGTNMTVSGSTIVCVSQQQTQSSVNNNVNTNTITVGAPVAPQVVYATAPAAAPQVVYTTVADVKQLPKTGLPLAAWFVSGLLPVGLKLKKFGKAAEGTVNAGLQIWQARAMQRDLSA